MIMKLKVPCVRVSNVKLELFFIFYTMQKIIYKYAPHAKYWSHTQLEINTAFHKCHCCFIQVYFRHKL